MLATHIASFAASPLRPWIAEPPWSLTSDAPAIVAKLLAALDPDGFIRHDGSAVHRSATVEPGAVVKAPAIIGPDCFVATGGYLRGGTWLDRGVIIGPGAELKSSFLFARAKLAHFNFVGDSILGTEVNLEAGSIIANYRNERAEKRIRVRIDGRLTDTGIDKFGALVGDGARIGANAVLAPGTVITPRQVVPRLALVDQESDAISG